jgi:hypothetical protein
VVGTPGGIVGPACPDAEDDGLAAAVQPGTERMRGQHPDLSLAARHGMTAQDLPGGALGKEVGGQLVATKLVRVAELDEPVGIT